tara:strand:- start:2594 stop:3244 length:651 start_codon:yes stop_codon:yes gene_type:complete
MTDKCLIEQTKRARVGGTGPKRNKLKTFEKIDQVSQNVVDELNYILDTDTRNDIGGDNYGISQNCNYEEVFNVSDKYRQILLQKKIEDSSDDVNEYLYTNWDPNHNLRYTMPTINRLFDNVYRFRMSEMKGDHELNWHIDADTSVICRAQICLKESDSTLEFKDKAGIHQLRMYPGEVWFINTGWNHRVVNGGAVRRSAIFGFHFNDLKNKDLLLL